VYAAYINITVVKLLAIHAIIVLFRLKVDVNRQFP